MQSTEHAQRKKLLNLCDQSFGEWVMKIKLPLPLPKLKKKADRLFSIFRRLEDADENGYCCKKCRKPVTKYCVSGICKSCGMIGNKRCRGIKWTPKRRNKLSESYLGEKNPNWKGDKVGDKGLHRWVERRLPKPNLCDFCKINKPMDLANKGVYERNLWNWNWLCRKCHMKSDGRLKNLINQK